MGRVEFISLPQRGLRVIPPPETQANMRLARAGNIVRWTPEEKARLRLLVGCKILANRHPTAEDGHRYMEHVDHARRQELFAMAQDLTSTIAHEWKVINPQEDIAVLLYGSVSKGLVRRGDHPDPSNIDLAVIGSITDVEKDSLFEAIRPKRAEIQRKILRSVPHLESLETNPGNAGVVIQNTEKVIKSNFSVARGYISARAIAIHDPSGLWANIEFQALHATLNSPKWSGGK